MNEERNDLNELPRRRRRVRITEEENMETPVSAQDLPETPAAMPDSGETVKPETRPEHPLVQGADSRVPAEARLMSAAPYGTAGGAVRSRPGTRPMTAARRPEGASPVRAYPPVRETYRGGNRTENGQDTISHPLEEMTSRVHVGYAPGRMSERNQAPETVQTPENDRMQARVREYPEYSYAASRPARQESTGPAGAEQRRITPLHILVTILVIAGLALTALLVLPAGSGLREKAAAAIQGLLGGEKQEDSGITGFNVFGDQGLTAPADVTFSITANKNVRDVRLVDESGESPDIIATGENNADENIWTLRMHVENGYEGELRLQVLRSEEAGWQDTEFNTEVLVLTPAFAEPTDPEESGTQPEANPETGETAEPEGLTGEPDGRTESPMLPEGADADGVPDGTDEPEQPEETGEPEVEATETPAPTETPEPTPEPTSTPEPTPTPALTAEADEKAAPGLIATTVVYNGSKKVKEFSRAAKEVIRMPAGWDYVKKVQMGVLTFRGNAFRTNGAVGTVESADTLQQIWEVQTGSVRGSSQTYYGTEWTGQPAIVQWSRQVRELSNIDESKRSVKSLKEVIVAGADGNIRFLDLEDGNMTRNSIKLGYPMRGTPSVHPGGFPYMNVGQYARKMKVKTGKIGLRQYNLYTQKELTLVDGLDGTMHRAYNDAGSFETSALIDRTSDCVVTAGTNGMLYLINLNSEFDYLVGSYKSKPSTIVMISKTKGQKNVRTAVESSIAMYDKYVYYADMDGILRCVDTDHLAPVWAVNTGDAVMAAVALDMPADEQLDLYTANMLVNRKRGSAQIRRYDALSGKEIWCTEIGVAKDSKGKTDSGCKASPVIGENRLDGLVYFTVTGLNDDGRAKLNVKGDAKAALAALDKETGKIVWAYGLSDRSVSSPIAVYDGDGNGRIIQCAWDGSIIMVDGLTGELAAQITVEGNIEASPAAYNDIMVVGTTGKDTEHIYGIRIR
ncbi:PQQ-binding-like beta-propeller repeat protein [Clostridiales bacterium]|nr:PQQ-binding-like beta-propeller repeat protein [Clostridiales bacterium]